MRLFTTFVDPIVAVLCLGANSIGYSNELPNQSILGYWMVADSSLIVEIKACSSNSDWRCGYIRALPPNNTGQELSPYASVLCNLTLIDRLKYNQNKSRWEGGTLFDPESNEYYDLVAFPIDNKLSLRAYLGKEKYGENLVWTPATPADIGCVSKNAGRDNG